MADATVATVTDTVTLIIDYSQSLEEMVAAGDYDSTGSDITEENFPVGEGASEVEAVLVNLGRYETSDEAIAELERQGLRPATMVELLAFCAQPADPQRDYSIVALGSIWASPDGRSLVGYLWGSAGYPKLDLGWYGGEWGRHFCFLAVRK